MSPTIDLSASTFARLQSHATPLVDTVETTILKVLDLADQVLGGSVHGSNSSGPESAIPNLAFTTITSASINGKSLSAGMRNWNAILLEVASLAAAKMPKGKSVGDLIIVNHVVGSKNDNGYKFIQSAGISVQGQNANNAWKAIAHVAKACGIKVNIKFSWSSSPQAQKPGQSGELDV